MPETSPPATRRSERKRAVNTRIQDLDSSPTQRAQPASRKRKASGNHAPRARPRQQTPDEELAEPDHDSDDETAVNDDEDDEDDDENKELAELIIPYLTVAPDPVTVASEYTNSKIQERYGEGEVQAFAKLCGKDWTYYVKKQRIIFGRQPDRYSRESVGVGADVALQDEGDESRPVDIDLGPSKVVSRVHAQLVFMHSDDKWHVNVGGRNGVKINDECLRRGESRAIQSGTVISIAGTQIFFQAPNGKTEIHQTFIDKILQNQNNEGLDAELGSRHQHILPERPMYGLLGGGLSSYQNYAATSQYARGQTAIAPAPAYPARPVTPDASPLKRVATGSAKKKSPSHRHGIMMESTEQIDYSLDSSKDLKPGCSYASMITWAILSTPEKSLSLSGIYAWIKAHYAFYRIINSGWQNSIRHNLSLNKAFQKIPRKADEPGKGMKWQLNPDHYDETIAQAEKNASKGGGRISSAPGSPAGKAFSSGFLPTATNGVPKSSPISRTPPLSSYPPTQQENFTPTRDPQMPAYAPTQGRLPFFSDQTSPLPRRRTNGHLAAADSSPILTSGAWGHDQPMRTPAPQAYNLNFPQPNTARLPTSHMADSSPAPFWRYHNMGSTPAGHWPEISPIKNGTAGRVPELQSSSPPPIVNGVDSPTRRARPMGVYGPTQNLHTEDEDVGIDITKGFSTISSFHQQRSNVASNTVGS